MKLTYSGKTDIGLERKVNQDCFGSADLPWGSIFILSDGFGHKEGGQFASEYAVEIFIKKFSEQNPGDAKKFCHNTFKEINKYIYYKKVSEYQKAMLGCTAVVLIIIENIAYVAHIGDSRAYIIQDDTIRKITTDHSYVQVLIDRGELTPDKAMLHSKRHVLSRCLGSHQKAKSDYSRISIVKKDKFMLCCDGVWGFASPDKMKDIIINNTPNEATTKIIDMVKKNSGSDNITLQVISFSK